MSDLGVDLNGITQSFQEFVDRTNDAQNRTKIKRELRNCGISRRKVEAVLSKYKSKMDDNERKMFKDRISELNSKIRQSLASDRNDLKSVSDTADNFCKEWENILKSR